MIKPQTKKQLQNILSFKEAVIDEKIDCKSKSILRTKNVGWWKQIKRGISLCN